MRKNPVKFMPEDRVRRVTVRVVKGLPDGLILGAAFLQQHESVLNYAVGGGFKPAPESPWVPLRSIAGYSTPAAALRIEATPTPEPSWGLPTIGGRSMLMKKMAIRWKATPRKNYETLATILETEVTPWERFVQWHHRQQRKNRRG